MVRIQFPKFAIQDVEVLVRKIRIHLQSTFNAIVSITSYTFRTAKGTYLIDIFFFIHSVKRTDKIAAPKLSHRNSAAAVSIN